MFFFDLGLLGLLVATDGAVSQQTIASLLAANPAGLYRLQMMQAFAGPEVLEDLGMVAAVPGAGVTAALWAAWVVLPNLASGLWIAREKTP